MDAWNGVQEQQLTSRDKASDKTQIAFDLASALAKIAWASPEKQSHPQSTFKHFLKATMGTATRTHQGLG